ncbi:MAG TPA: sulfatase/phosphatase domain-containing protein, partial [Chloroflexota bacterium]|nr:sulfatase/phosphatase domain-containing protein [Chloroflexota bacterium]
ELFDLTPTVLELAGIARRHTHFARSLVPQLRGEPGDPGRAAFAEGGYDPYEPHCFEGHEGGEQWLRAPGHIYAPKVSLQQSEPRSVCRATMIRTLTHKLVRRPRDVSELYDLQNDPDETRNLYNHPAYTAVQRDLELRLLDWHIQTADVTPFDENPRGHTKLTS